MSAVNCANWFWEENPMRMARTILTWAAFGLFAHLCWAQKLTIAAASDLQAAMQEVASAFEKETGAEVQVIYGSSGNFFQQIQNGAPFDMFFSANIDFPRKLEAGGLTEAGSFHRYARGKIVIWVPNDSSLTLDHGLPALLDPSIKKIAIANPLHAPYGQAAVSAMQKEGIYEKVKEKLVLGENISQTASFVTTGAADVGIIALSLALSPNMKGKGRYVQIPTNDYPPVDQACVILNSSKNKPLAQRFLAYIKSASASKELGTYGFDVSSQSAR
jgi:molybdate transport system substrate-binding protein